MNDVVVTRNNFKNMRMSYGIKLKDISQKCGVSESCINNFENSTGSYMDTNARDYNKSKICRTLQEMIESKILNLYDVPEKEEKKVEAKEKRKLGGLLAESDIPRKTLCDYIIAYCKHNTISTGEFCKMCKINAVYTSPSAGKGQVYATVGTLDKILGATGWTKEQIMAGFKTEDIPKPVVKEEAPVKEDRRNVVCTMENGKYFIEYDVVTRIKRNISKEEFLKEVGG
ncbi:MAG: helix-turn-helix transcriptional regulator [Clostridiales bacterium]|nr:helix-turn-helix transcriptional regulator [Clostridiales bacterium]